MDDKTEVKITVIGDGKAGKTSMLNLFKDHSFSSIYTPTSFDLLSIEKEYKSKNIKLNFWDTAGQEEFLRLAPLHLPNTDLLVLCFSCCDIHSFVKLSKWKTIMEVHCKNTPFILICCKIDMRHNIEEIQIMEENNEAMVTNAMGMEMANQIGAYRYYECSAKDNVGDKPILDFMYEWTYENFVTDKPVLESVNQMPEKEDGGFFKTLMRWCGCGSIDE